MERGLFTPRNIGSLESHISLVISSSAAYTLVRRWSIAPGQAVYAVLMELKEKVRSYLGKRPVVEKPDMYQRDGRIQRETNTSSIKDREPTLPRGKLRPNSTK